VTTKLGLADIGQLDARAFRAPGRDR